MLFILCDLLHSVDAIPEKSLSVLFLGGISKHISQAHISEERIQLFLEISQVHQHQPQLSCLLVSQTWIDWGGIVKLSGLFG
jgi:hypothetical protein